MENRLGSTPAISLEESTRCPSLNLNASDLEKNQVKEDLSVQKNLEAPGEEIIWVHWHEK